MGRKPVVVGIVVIAFTGGCAGDDAKSDDAPAVAAPDAPGPYAVGVTTIEVENGDRKLPVEIWYPARAEGDVEDYVLMLGVIELAKIASPLQAVRDAPLDRRGAPYPTVMFSHGNGGVRIQSVYMTEYLATHGFVVAAPDHVGNTFAEQVNKANALEPADAARLRPIDISRALDGVLAHSNSEGDTLDGAVDEKRIGVAGHSFGGFTALRVAGATIDRALVLQECASGGGLVCDGWENVEMPESARDDRVSAALAQAPGGAAAMLAGGGNGFADVATITMIQGGTSDELTPFASEQQAPYDGLPTPAWLVGIDRAGHFTFSDMCLVVEEVGLSVEEFQDGCGPDNVPYSDAHRLIDLYSTAFFQHALGNRRIEDSVLAPDAAKPSGVAVFSMRQ